MSFTETKQLQAKRLALSDENDALRFIVSDIVRAWDSLKPGSYDKDIWETWLIQKMKPAIDRARIVSSSETKDRA